MNIENVNKAIAELKYFRDEFKKKSKVMFEEFLHDFFASNPEVKTIYWCQYTPYFNDGDACVFGIGEVHFSPLTWKNISGPYAGEDTEEESDRDFYAGEKTKWQEEDTRISQNTKDSINKIYELFDMSGEHLQNAYGDHVFVRLYFEDGKVKSEIEDYDHD